MKLTLFAGVGILACHSVYVDAKPISAASVTSTQHPKPKNEGPLKPVALEVASNGIIAPGNPGLEYDRGIPIDSHPFNNLETFPVILPEDDTQDDDDAAEDTSLAKRHHDRPHHHQSYHNDEHNHNPFRAGDIFLGHGPVVRPSHPIVPSKEPPKISSSPDITARYLVIPIPQFNRDSGSLVLSSADAPAPPKTLVPAQQAAGLSAGKTSINKHLINNVRLAESPRISKSVTDKSRANMYKLLPSKSRVGKSDGNKMSVDGKSLNGILPTIPRCLELLKPLRDLAERVVYIKEAPHHTLLAACHFNSLNKTHYDGSHVEHMREICWNLFETIQQEGRRRWERCLLKADDKLHKPSPSSKENPIHESEHGLDKFSFRAYQVTPGLVKEFIAEHPDLSPDDIEWLMHDVKSSGTNSPDTRSASQITRRSWIGDLFKAIFSAEVNTTINQIGKGVGGIVADGVANKSSNDHSVSLGQNTTKTPHTKAHPKTTHTTTTHTKRDPQGNRIYVHGKYYPIAPINKYVNHPRATSKPPFRREDINTYLEFVRETRQLSRKQSKRLRAAVEQELRLHSHLKSFTEAKDDSQEEHSNSIKKRSGPPPTLEPSYSRPYQWNFPSDLGDNPAYINLTLAWKNTVTSQQKEWIALQLRNVWALRVGALCKISHSWTKDLSKESQEIELKFKGLSLQRCKEIRKGTRRNWRVGTYWKSLRGDEDITSEELE
jgi:hypothetical protein